MASGKCETCGGLTACGPFGWLCEACLTNYLKPQKAAHWESLSSDLSESSDQTATSRIGPYLLIERIASGGMGIVFRARSEELGREVALKLMRSEGTSNAVARARFRTEAEAVADLDHPNIVPIFDVGEHSGTPYFSMKLIEGQSLASRKAIKQISRGFRKPQSAENKKHHRESATLTAKIARAVDHAHCRGILHRDLKPENVLVDTRGTPFVTDFGLAKRIDRQDRLTLTHAVIGTPSFMSPEQATGDQRSISLTSDVYSLGAILFYLLTGAPPFQGSSAAIVLRKVVEEDPPPPWELNPNCDRDLALVALKALNKESHQRYSNARDFAEDIERWLRGEAILARPSSSWELARRWVRRRPFLGAAISVSIISATVLGIQGWLNYQAQRTQQEVIRATSQQLSKTLADVRIRDADKLLSVGRDGEAIAQLTANIRQAVSPNYSAPFLASVLENSRFPRRLGPPIEHGTIPSVIVFHPDGTHIATASFKDTSCRLWNIFTGKSARPALEHQESVYQISFSQDGTRMVTGATDGTARVWDTFSGEPLSPLLRHEGQLHITRFNNERDVIVTAGEDCQAKVWHGDGSGLAYPVFKHPSEEIIIHIAEHVPNRNLFLTGSVRGNFWLWEVPSGRLVKKIDAPPKYVRFVSFNPSGDQFASVEEFGIALFDSTTLDPITFIPHPSASLNAFFDKSGRRLLTNAQDGLRLFDTKTATTIEGLPEIDMTGSRLDAVPRKNAFLVTKLNRITGFDLESLSPSFAAIFASSGIRNVAASPYHDRVAFTDNTGNAEIWEIPDQKDLGITNRSRNGALYSQAHFVTGDQGKHKLLVAERSNGEVEFLSLESTLQSLDQYSIGTPHPVIQTGSGKQMVGFYGYGQPHQFMVLDTHSNRQHIIKAPKASGAFSLNSDETWMATLSNNENSSNRGAQIYSFSEEDFIGRRIEGENSILVLDVSPSDKHIATGDVSGYIQLWDAANQNLVDQKHIGNLPIIGICFTPDSRGLIATGRGGRIQAWSIDESLTPLWSKELNVDVSKTIPAQLIVSPDEQMLAIATMDGSIHCWNVLTGEERFPSIQHDGEIKHIAFVPNSELLLAVTAKGKYRFWNKKTGAPASASSQWHNSWTTVKSSPCGQYYSVGMADGSIAIRRVPNSHQIEAIPEWFPAFAEAYAGVKLTNSNRPKVIPWKERLDMINAAREQMQDTPLATWARELLESGTLQE